MEVWVVMHENFWQRQRSEEFMLSIAEEGRRLGDLFKTKVRGITIESEDGAPKPSSFPQALDGVYILKTADKEIDVESYADAVADLFQEHGPAILVMAGNSLGSDMASRLAVKLDLELYPRIVDYEERQGRVWVRRSVYNDAVHITTSLEASRGAVVTVLPDALVPTGAFGEIGEAVSLPVRRKDSGIRKRVDYLKLERLPREEIALDEATVVIGVGGGVANKEGVALVDKLAELLDAPLGCSKAVVDMGLLPRNRQIGLSGTSLNAEKYLAIGISGATYHVEGIRQVKKVIAINTDSHAPISNLAQLVMIGDFREVVPALIKEIKETQSTEKTP